MLGPSYLSCSVFRVSVWVGFDSRVECVCWCTPVFAVDVAQMYLSQRESVDRRSLYSFFSARPITQIRTDEAQKAETDLSAVRCSSLAQKIASTLMSKLCTLLG